AAHARGLIHRDIKPANIWLEQDGGRVKVLDFGLARAADGETELTDPGTVAGTPAYAAPEQLRGEKVDGRCDLFSLGCILYRLVTGAPPSAGRDKFATMMAVGSAPPASPRSLNPDVPPELAGLVMRLLAKDPGDRPASATEVAAALQKIEGV